MRGEEVTVLRPSQRLDGTGELVTEWEGEAVGDVLVAPGPASGVASSDRPAGTRASYTLAFPKTFCGSLRGCRVEVRGETFAVVGDPRPNQEWNCPTRWWLSAEVERVQG